MIISQGDELITAITNIIIMISSIIIFFNANKKEKLWRVFYILMIVNSFLGVIIHGLLLNEIIKKILWLILSLSFTITINTLYYIFKNKYKINSILKLSLSVYLIFLIETIIKIDFLNTFIIYAGTIVVLSLYNIIKNKRNNYKIFIFAFILQIIGGILLLFKIRIGFIDKNSLYHLFMEVTLLLFYLGNRNVKYLHYKTR